MRTIQIEVSDEIASKISRLSSEKKEELTQLISLWVEKDSLWVEKDIRTFREVIKDMSEYAQKQGLTPEILEKLLNEE